MGKLFLYFLFLFSSREIRLSSRFFIPTWYLKELNILPLREGSEWSIIEAKEILPSGSPIYPSRKLKTLLNLARTSAGFPSPGEVKNSCSGVVIGIVDTGLDLYHPDFLYENGHNVFAYVWDQTDDTGPHPDGFTYGRECDTWEILRGTCPVTDDDLIGHGTHISGILASRNKNLTGLCSDSLFIFVKTTYEEADVVDAVCYVAEKARRFSLPFVVNLSLGGSYGPHDGTTPFEKMLVECAGENGVIVAAGGNDGGEFLHCGNYINIPSACMAYSSSFPVLGTSLLGIEIWAEGNGSCFVTVNSEQSILYRTENVGSGELREFTFSTSGKYPVKITVDATDFPSFMNGDAHCTITISGREISSYSYGIGFDPSGEKIRMDAWIIEGTGYFSDEVTMIGDLYFLEGDDFYTINIPSTSPEIISVVSFVSRNSWKDKNGVERQEPITLGNISDFSSKGPSRKNIFKPDISAPGQVVFSTRSSSSNVGSTYTLEDGMHSALWGTSVAAPFVTGIVAEIFSLNPFLKRNEILEIIHNSGASDSFTGILPNEIWGYGKINLEKIKEKISKKNLPSIQPEILKWDVDFHEDYAEILWESSIPSRGKVIIPEKSPFPLFLSSPTLSPEGMVKVMGRDRILRFYIILNGYDGEEYTFGEFLKVKDEERSFGCAMAEKSSSSEILFIIFIFYIVFKNKKFMLN